VIVLGRIDWKRVRTVVAWVLLAGSLVGWPVSMFTWAKDEPPFILSLSWLAIVIEAASLLTSSQVHEETGKADH
jgi:ribose/xylose/arabinose/galactoside ABC-type transport system permease subunit